MSALRIHGVSVGFSDIGAGTPVLFLHAGGASGSQWRGVTEALGSRWRAVTVDFHGFGETDPWPGKPEARTHEHDMELCLGVLEHLGLGDIPVHVVGHSFGGGVGLCLAVLHPGRVRSLVLIEPIANALLDETGDPLAAVHRNLARSFMDHVGRGEIETAWRNFIDANNGAGTWDAWSRETQVRMMDTTGAALSGYHANLNQTLTLAECRRIAHPTLILRGGNTMPEFARMAEVLAGGIPGSALSEVPGAGHMSPMTHPAPVAAAIQAHLTGAERAGSRKATAKTP